MKSLKKYFTERLCSFYAKEWGRPPFLNINPYFIITWNNKKIKWYFEVRFSPVMDYFFIGKNLCKGISRIFESFSRVLSVGELVPLSSFTIILSE